MTRWQVTILLVLGLFVALPLAWPLSELSLSGLVLAPRTLSLARNTILLVLTTLTLSLPIGVVLAILLERTDLPASRLLLSLFLMALFVPLPLFLSGWLVVLPGFLGGLGSAAFLHAVAALPWVVLIVGLGLRGVERELEDEARLVRPAYWVLWHVTLRRALPSLLAASLWIVAQTSGEISITDLMQVRTFAEEVYVQLIAPDSEEPVGRAVTVALVGVVVLVVLVASSVRRIDRLVPSGDVSYREFRYLRLGVWRWPLAVVVGFTALVLLGIPTFALLHRAGSLGGVWSLGVFVGQLRRSLTFDAELLVRSLVVAAISGMLTASVAVVVCWPARGSRWFGVMVLLLLATAWAMPGPILALGLKGLIPKILNYTDPISRLLAVLLWYGPSIVPLLEVNFVRFLPFAAAIVWPTIRRLPPGLFDLARLDGISPTRELFGIVWPLARRAWGRAVLAVAVLSLGELSAGKIVSTPRGENFAEAIWTQMHYGVTADLAARCLVLLAIVFAGAALLLWLTRRSAHDLATIDAGRLQCRP